MINAASSIAGTILSNTFGTPASTPSPTSPTTASSPASSDAYILAGSLGSDPEASLLSNIIDAQATEVLLQDPHANGALTGTPSSYVQQIINALAPGADPANQTPVSSTPSTNADSPTSALPPGGLLA